MREAKYRMIQDEECSASEMKGVVYTALSLLGGLVSISIGLAVILI
jgi:hypothetical protein